MDSNYKYMLLATASTIGALLYFNNIIEIKNLMKRSQLLMTHGNAIYLDSEKIKEYKENLNSTLSLQHEDIEISEQIKLFSQNYTKDELLIMENNLHKLEVDYNGSSIFVGGSYNMRDNKIALNPLYDNSTNKYKEALNHEFHHMASNLGTIENYIICGFEQLKIGNSVMHIGKGLNEAYTEYLSMMMLKKEDYQYKKIVDIIPLIELFYDNKSELRSSYFNADLPSVIQKFSEIVGSTRAIELVRKIDKLLFYSSNITWFDKSNELELDIRTTLYDYYKKISGCLNKEDLFFEEQMIKEVYKKTRK